MSNSGDFRAPSRTSPDTHQRNADKLKRIPIKVEPSGSLPPKPAWIRTRLRDAHKVGQIKRVLRESNLHSVCEEAACPNLSECFSHGTATFMILGDLCTRRCPFCDVAHGRPSPPDPSEPEHLATSIERLNLKYVVITSVDRDDLRDGGAQHFADCIEAIRNRSPHTRIEILTPDFRGRQVLALDTLAQTPPDVFNHNLETVPRLYRAARPGADYQVSLELLQGFKAVHPGIPTKSGIMLGLGETFDEVSVVLSDLKAHGCDMLTIGQYLQPSREHYPVFRYAPLEEFAALAELAHDLGFSAVASAPMVRSSYHADQQAAALL
jgi:lipoic acid synthetase